MAFVSTGAGAVGGTTSTITTEPFMIPPGVRFLTLDFNFLTNEAPNDFFNDTLLVRLTTPTGVEEKPLASLQTSGFISGGDSGFGLMTGFSIVQLDVASHAGSAISLTFEIRVFDVGDSIVDSAVLVDNLRFE